MRANELRINNAVFCKYRKGYFLVKEITETWLRIADPKIGYLYSESYETVVPIELTPEILEGCGFENIGEPFRKWISEEIGIDITERPAGEYFARFIKRYRMSGNTMHADKLGPYIEMIFCPTPFKYLHQLMNFWYSLAGAELPISLKALVK
jgi:hypothetical protein